jgi:exopolysaccharide biosynthesis protein
MDMTGDDRDGNDSDVYYEEPVITDTSYHDNDISIEISQIRKYDTDIYIAEVILEKPYYLKTGLANGVFGRNIVDTTSSIAEENNAIFAINGDYYGFRTSGYVMRRGQVFRDSISELSYTEDLVIYKDGNMEIIDEIYTSMEELQEKGAREVFSFGPGLVENGEVSVSKFDEVDRSQEMNPRTAIGQAGPLHYFLVVSDGRTKQSPGMSLLQLAQVMQELGCETAYNLDGGGSSAIWFNGKILNKPTTYGKVIEERSISDIVYIGK